MNNYLGDFAEDTDVYIVFDTADDTGLSITATIAVADIEVYKQQSGAIDLTQRTSTTGFTLDVDHDAMTGTHMVAIDTSDDTHVDFFEPASDYFVKLNTITVDGISISKWIGHFSIENRYSAGALRPTVAARTLDVASTGEAGLDFANVLSAPTGFIAATFPTGTIANTTNLTAGTIAAVSGAVNSVTTTVTADVDTIKTQVVTCAAGVTINPSVGAATIQPTVTQFDLRTLVAAGYASPTNITGGVITTVTNLTNAPTAGDLTAAMKTAVNVEVVDVLKTDTIADLAAAAPPTTPTFEEAVMYLYSALVHRIDVDKTAAFKEYFNNADVLIWKKALTDDGTTYQEAESVTG